MGIYESICIYMRRRIEVLYFTIASIHARIVFHELITVYVHIYMYMYVYAHICVGVYSVRYVTIATVST